MTSPRAKRSYWGLQWIDRNGVLTTEAVAALEDIAEQFDQPELTNKTGQATSSVITSDAITLSGAQDETWPLTVRGGTSAGLSIDGTNFYPWVIARAGDSLYVRQTSSGSSATTTTVTVYGPGRSETWSVTTA